MTRLGSHRGGRIRTRFRIVPRYGVDPGSNFPCLDYMIQRRVWFRWQDSLLFTDEDEAKKYVMDMNGKLVD